MNRTEVIEQIARNVTTSENKCYGVVTGYREGQYLMAKLKELLADMPSTKAGKELRLANGCRVYAISDDNDSRGRSLDGLFVDASTPEESVKIHSCALLPNNPGGMVVFN